MTEYRDALSFLDVVLMVYLLRKSLLCIEERPVGTWDMRELVLTC